MAKAIEKAKEYRTKAKAWELINELCELAVGFNTDLRDSMADEVKDVVNKYVRKAEGK